MNHWKMNHCLFNSEIGGEKDFIKEPFWIWIISQNKTCCMLTVRCRYIGQCEFGSKTNGICSTAFRFMTRSIQMQTYYFKLSPKTTVCLGLWVRIYRVKLQDLLGLWWAVSWGMLQNSWVGLSPIHLHRLYYGKGIKKRNTRNICNLLILSEQNNLLVIKMQFRNDQIPKSPLELCLVTTILF